MSSHWCNLSQMWQKRAFWCLLFYKASTPVSTGNTEEKASSFLGTMTEDNKDSWYIDIQMRQRVITFKIDTGAKVTAISGKTHQLIGKPKWLILTRSFMVLSTRHWMSWVSFQDA